MRLIPQQLKMSFWITTILILVSCNSLSAKDILIAFPSSLPPWTLQASDAGITLEIVRESLKIRGHRLKTKYLSLKQLNRTLETDSDAHAQVESREMKGYYSDKIMDFQTSLISLKPNGFKIQKINDLNDKQIISFQNASVLFGNAFQAMTQTNPRYQEIADQERQVVQLYNGQTDLILIDRHIFLYFRRSTAMTNTSMSIAYHQIPGLTDKSPAFVVFQDKDLRDDFNTGLQQLKDSGDYYDIFYKYTN